MNKHAGYDLDSKFKLTGETGSYRYMAPEVFRHEPYNFKVCIADLTISSFLGCFEAHGWFNSLSSHCKPSWQSCAALWCVIVTAAMVLCASADFPFQTSCLHSLIQAVGLWNNKNYGLCCARWMYTRFP